MGNHMAETPTERRLHEELSRVSDALAAQHNEHRNLREENQRLRELAGAMARAMISYELTVDEPAPYKHRMLIKQARALLPDTYFDPLVKYDAKEESERWD